MKVYCRLQVQNVPRLLAAIAATFVTYDRIESYMVFCAAGEGNKTLFSLPAQSQDHSISIHELTFRIQPVSL